MSGTRAILIQTTSSYGSGTRFNILTISASPSSSAERVDGRPERDAHGLHVCLVADGERFGAVQQNAAVPRARDERVGAPRLGQAHPEMRALGLRLHVKPREHPRARSPAARAISLRFHSAMRPATPSVMRLVDSSAIAGGAFTIVRSTETDRRSIADAGASR